MNVFHECSSSIRDRNTHVVKTTFCCGGVNAETFTNSFQRKPHIVQLDYVVVEGFAICTKGIRHK